MRKEKPEAVNVDAPVTAGKGWEKLDSEIDVFTEVLKEADAAIAALTEKIRMRNADTQKK